MAEKTLIQRYMAGEATDAELQEFAQGARAEVEEIMAATAIEGDAAEIRGEES